MKNETLNLRTTEDIKRRLEIIAANKGLSINRLVDNYIEAGIKEDLKGCDLSLEAEGIIDLVTEKIQVFEAVRDYERDLTPQEEQFYEILNLTYEIMARSKLCLENPANMVENPCPESEEEKGEKIYRHGMSAHSIADDIIKNL